MHDDALHVKITIQLLIILVDGMGVKFMGVGTGELLKRIKCKGKNRGDSPREEKRNRHRRMVKAEGE